jgi:hypothetical protein
MGTRIRLAIAAALSLNVSVLAVAQNVPSFPNEEETEEYYKNLDKEFADQDKALSAWKTEKQGIFTVHSPPVGNTKVISFQGDVDRETAKNAEGLTRLMAVAEAACPGFSKKEIVKKKFGAGGTISTETDKNYCLLESSRSAKAFVKNGAPAITFDESPLVVVLLLRPKTDNNPASNNVSMGKLAKRILQKLAPAIYLRGTAQSSEVMANAAVNNLPGNKSNDIAVPQSPSTSLKAAMDAIPRANRPIGMAMKEGEWDSYKMMVEYTNMVLFPSGVAIPATCRNWNPQKPVGPAMGCGITRYTLSNGRVTFSGDKEPADLSDFSGFMPGKSILINVGNIGGGGASTYGGSINQVSGGELKMTLSGDISSGDWVSNSIQGGNYSGYAGSNAAGVTGKYYLDGYLIAVQDRNGQISIGFIGQKTEGRDIYTYMNGEQYWK